MTEKYISCAELEDPSKSMNEKYELSISGITIGNFDQFGVINFVPILQAINFKEKCKGNLNSLWKQECIFNNPYALYHDVYREYPSFNSVYDEYNNILKNIYFSQSELLLKKINNIPESGVDWRDKKLYGINQNLIDEISITPKTKFILIYRDESQLSVDGTITFKNSFL